MQKTLTQKTPPQKTWKRETALLMIFFLLFLAIFDLLSGGGTGALEWASLFALPFIGFAAAAFGLDAATKQGRWGRPHGGPDHLPPEGFAND
ncbi:hypothetical protein [Roseibium algae]|uniref:Uncharacterized protein n=1 Tax=Roseibium algae TaxID=3123038 RepID=A0ABU8TJX4_9HYPH